MTFQITVRCQHSHCSESNVMLLPTGHMHAVHSIPLAWDQPVVSPYWTVSEIHPPVLRPCAPAHHHAVPGLQSAAKVCNMAHSGHLSERHGTRLYLKFSSAERSKVNGGGGGRDQAPSSHSSGKSKQEIGTLYHLCWHFVTHQMTE